MNTEDRLIVALDGDWGMKELIDKARKLAGFIGMAKLGMRLFTRHGPDAVKKLLDSGISVFLDLKYHDIPNTAATACEEAAKLGCSMLTVHASGGEAMMKRIAEQMDGYRQRSGKSGPKIVGVTALTSLDEAQLHGIGVGGDVAEQVQRLAMLTKKCGLDGVVASPKEIKLIRECCGEDFIIVTPGIRPAGVVSGEDQRRVTTPAEAVESGASYIVVGRPIIAADDPIGAARDIARQIGAD